VTLNGRNALFRGQHASVIAHYTNLNEDIPMQPATTM